MIPAVIGSLLILVSLVLLLSGVSAGSTLPLLCGTLLFPIALFIAAFNLGRATKKLHIEVTDRTRRLETPVAQSQIDYDEIAARVVSQLRATRKP